MFGKVLLFLNILVINGPAGIKIQMCLAPESVFLLSSQLYLKMASWKGMECSGACRKARAYETGFVNVPLFPEMVRGSNPLQLLSRTPEEK